jgi:adenosine deaminase
MPPVKFHGPKRTQKSVPLSRAELHIHLDGSVRLSTVWELSKQKNIPLPGNGSIAALEKVVHMSEPSTLAGFLSGFQYTSAPLTGDIVAMERVAYEFCEDISSHGVLYVEARFCPHLLVSPDGGEDSATADHILEAVLRGFDKGSVEFGVTVRTLLCCIRGLPQFDKDIVRLADKYRDKGVVGIDVAGDEGHLEEGKSAMFEQSVIDTYDEARKLGLNRTAHDGEVGPAACVEQALTTLSAMRIGHGYRVLENPELYEKCLKDKVHFETCPTSSILTGAQPTDIFYHAVVKFAEDGANLSINSDDPMVTGTWIEQEYELVRSWGLNEAYLTRANFNAIRSCFLPPDEKKEMLKKMREVNHIHLD